MTEKTSIDQRPAMPDFRMTDVAFALGRWFWELVGVFSLIVLMGIGYIGLIRDPMFESSARLFVRVSQEQAPPNTVFAQTGVTFLTQASGDVTSEIDLMLSSDVFNRIIDRGNLLDAINAPPPPPVGLVQTIKRRIQDTLQPAFDFSEALLIRVGLKTPLTPREALLRQLHAGIRVQNSPGSDVIAVGFVWPNRDVPQPLLSLFIEEFLSYRLEIFRTNETQYFERQSRQVESEIAEISARIEALRERGNIHDLDAQRSSLISALENERSTNSQLSGNLAVAEERLAQLMELDDSTLGEELVLVGITNNPILVRLDERALELFEEMRLQTSAGGQIVQGQRNFLQREYIFLITAMEQALADHTVNLRLEKSTSDARLDELSENLLSLGELEADWRAARRDLTLAEESYAFFHARMDELLSVEALRTDRISNVLVIQEASEPTLSVGIRNSKLLMVISVVAFVFALAWVVLREFFDDKLQRLTDLEKLGMGPVIGKIARSKSREYGPDMARIASRLVHGRDKTGRNIVLTSPEKELKTPLAHAVDLGSEMDGQGAGPILVLDLVGGTFDETKATRIGVEQMLASPNESSGIAVVSPNSPEERDLLFDKIQKMRGATISPWRMTLIATEPLSKAPETYRAVMASGNLVLNLVSSKESGAAAVRAVGELKKSGVQVLGSILAEHRRVTPWFLRMRET